MDIALVWNVLGDKQPQVTRNEVAEWCTELNLPMASLAKHNMPATFRRMTDEVVHRYASNTHRVQLLATGKDTFNESVRDLYDYNVRDKDEEPVRIGQLKLRNTKIKRFGFSPDQYVLQFSVKRGMGPAYKHAAEDWFAKFQEEFASYQDLAPMAGIRSIIKQSIEEIGTPTRRRAVMYFVYQENFQRLKDLRIFFERLGTGGELFFARVQDGPQERSLMILAVDEFLSRRLVKLEAEITASATLIGEERWRHELGSLALEASGHESRLEATLLQTRQLIRHLSDVITTLAQGSE
jgi:hypothetical protein